MKHKPHADAVIWLAAALIMCIIYGVIIAKVARAQDGHGEGHAQFHDFYQHWKQPGTQMNDAPESGLSCCNAKTVYRNGVGEPIGHIGDCYPTRFRPNPLRNEKGHGYWQAQLDDDDRATMKQEWIEVPDAKVIREKNPDATGQDGHLCFSNGAVLCAVPPTGAL